LASISAHANEAMSAHVPVCIENNGVNPAFSQARSIASKMFADIDVNIQWFLSASSCSSGQQKPILIEVLINTRPEVFPRALASTQPYEGVHIQVFFDRVQRMVNPSLVPCLLAHVLVHEITHVLEQSTRHSPRGIMKAHWGPEDFLKMQWQPLAFSDDDVRLIRLGLAARRAETPTDPHSLP
jgi:hypothetical protein